MDYLKLDCAAMMEPVWSWNPSVGAAGISLGGDLKSITSLNKLTAESVMGNTSVAEFYLQIDRFGEHTYIGFNQNSPFSFNAWNHGYYLRVDSGKLAAMSGNGGTIEFGLSVVPGDKLTAIEKHETENLR
ncbi:Aste57867_11498 [Aphanomyces stellatus]|uniref:Aste57867_11498 protein n=1 Tax=Aphanomyces stellatus TaxID=120398 RepID=A0A485KUA9_9STRA|nr:hypothetical protein As57867_011455 [Aphanomyces stellatus]VFT88359.1 Aste57867_11498 [Aphanomyces stellatus]